MGMGQCPRNREAMGGCGRQAENSQLSLDPPVIASGRISIENACKAFLTEGQEHAAFATQKKYRLMLAKFRAFSANRGYTLIDQWGPSDVRDFRSSWSISPQTAQRRMSMLKAFFEYCLSNEWVERNAARLIKNPKGRDAGDRRNEQKLPFTDDDIKRMYDACPTTERSQHTNGPATTWPTSYRCRFIPASVFQTWRCSILIVCSRPAKF